MILLHLSLSNATAHNEEDLLRDVEKSLEIFASVSHIIVARRCADMIREVLDVAKNCVAKRRQQTSTSTAPAPVDAAATANTTPFGGAAPTYPAFGFSPSTMHPGPASAADTQAHAHAQAQNNNVSIPAFQSNADPSMGMPPIPTYGGGGDFFSSLFTQPQSFGPDGRENDNNYNHGLNAVEAATSARTGVLANLVDPGILEDFAFGDGDFSLFWGVDNSG